MTTSKPISELEARLKYTFKNRSLLETALTHPSYGADHHTQHYQRLEFLGDAILEMLVSRYLYFDMPEEQEGRLTRTRAALVCEEALVEIARGYDIGAHMFLSVGEERSGGREKPSILSDMMESVLAAVYLDGGLSAAEALVRDMYEGRIDRFTQIDPTDAKSRLQYLAQKNGQMPVYTFIEATGPAHDPCFVYSVSIAGKCMGTGKGRSKQAAQQEAARLALEALK